MVTKIHFNISLQEFNKYLWINKKVESDKVEITLESLILLANYLEQLQKFALIFLYKSSINNLWINKKVKTIKS